MKPRAKKIIILCSILVVVFCVIAYFYREPLLEAFSRVYYFLADVEKIREFIGSFGTGAPVVFIIMQILQVLLAPIPGEATGLIGGFLFGTLKGFFYSSIGLSLGSIINFMIGRFFGTRYISKLIPEKKRKKFDSLLKRQGIFVILTFFIFPGFPKDYLCLFLGLSSIPKKVFFIIACIGRMPGTFLLSLQGSSLYEKNYPVLIVTLVICVLLVLVMYRYKENVYRWVDKLNGRDKKAYKSNNITH